MTIAGFDFRQMARESLERARSELASGDRRRLKYVALELRETMEALTYDRAQAFQDEIPPEEYKTWQPRKLMAVLLELDPSIGKTATLHVGVEDEYGVPKENAAMQALGTDHVCTLADLKEHYDALGSYLHMPSLAQIRLGGERDLSKLRERCETIVGLVEKVLSSRVWNDTLGPFATLDECMNSICRKPIRKRIPVGSDAVDARCFECKAEYSIARQPDNTVLWKAKKIEVPCSTQGCPERMTLWPRQVAPGTKWLCRGCGVRNVISLSVCKLEIGHLEPGQKNSG